MTIGRASNLIRFTYQSTPAIIFTTIFMIALARMVQATPKYAFYARLQSPPIPDPDSS